MLGEHESQKRESAHVGQGRMGRKTAELLWGGSAGEYFNVVMGELPRATIN